MVQERRKLFFFINSTWYKNDTEYNLFHVIDKMGNIFGWKMFLLSSEVFDFSIFPILHGEKSNPFKCYFLLASQIKHRLDFRIANTLLVWHFGSRRAWSKSLFCHFLTFQVWILTRELSSLPASISVSFYSFHPWPEKSSPIKAFIKAGLFQWEVFILTN